MEREYGHVNLYVNTDLRYKMSMPYESGLCLIPRAAPVLMALGGRDFHVIIDPRLPDDVLLVKGKRGNVAIFSVGGKHGRV